MNNMERMKLRYDSEVVATYPKTGPGRQGYAEYHAVLAEACTGKKNLRVLDLGCGNGRYFHCLSNMALIVGIDISKDMLRAAECAFSELSSLRDAIPVFLEVDFHTLQFAPGSFDFIYSIGVVGELTPLDKRLLDSIINWLAPSGLAFFTVVDKNMYNQEHAGEHKSVKEIIREFIAAGPLLKLLPPQMAKRFVFSYDYKKLYKTRNELENMFADYSETIDYEINSFRDAKHPKLGCKIFKKQS